MRDIRRRILNHRHAVVALVGLLTIAASALALAAQRADRDSAKVQEPKRPKISVRAQPNVGMAPARVTLTGELQGGSDDFEEFYCPTVEWEWGDDTRSESSFDCEPYEAGKSQIKRRYTVQHTFRREGAYKVYFHLKRKDKFLGSASVTVQIQPGSRPTDF